MIAAGGILYPLLVSGHVQPWIVISRSTREEIIPMVATRDSSMQPSLSTPSENNSRELRRKEGVSKALGECARESSSNMSNLARMPKKAQGSEMDDCTVPMVQDTELTYSKVPVESSPSFSFPRISSTVKESANFRKTPEVGRHSASPKILPLEHMNGIANSTLKQRFLSSEEQARHSELSNGMILSGSPYAMAISKPKREQVRFQLSESSDEAFLSNGTESSEDTGGASVNLSEAGDTEDGGKWMGR